MRLLYQVIYHKIVIQSDKSLREMEAARDDTVGKGGKGVHKHTKYALGIHPEKVATACCMRYNEREKRGKRVESGHAKDFTEGGPDECESGANRTGY